MGFITAGLLTAFSTVTIQRKGLQVASLKIICLGILFFPKPLEELVFHKNALRNIEVKTVYAQKMWLLHPKEQSFALSFMGLSY